MPYNSPRKPIRSGISTRFSRNELRPGRSTATIQPISAVKKIPESQEIMSVDVLHVSFGKMTSTFIRKERGAGTLHHTSSQGTETRKFSSTTSQRIASTMRVIPVVWKAHSVAERISAENLEILKTIPHYRKLLLLYAETWIVRNITFRFIIR